VRMDGLQRADVAPEDEPANPRADVAPEDEPANPRHRAITVLAFRLRE